MTTDNESTAAVNPTRLYFSAAQQAHLGRYGVYRDLDGKEVAITEACSLPCFDLAAELAEKRACWPDVEFRGFSGHDCGGFLRAVVVDAEIAAFMSPLPPGSRLSAIHRKLAVIGLLMAGVPLDQAVRDAGRN